MSAVKGKFRGIWHSECKNETPAHIGEFLSVLAALKPFQLCACGPMLRRDIVLKNVEELNATLAYIDATDAEKDFSEIHDSLPAKFENQCMYCNHCQPCPMGIDIAEVTKLADMAREK